MSKEITVPKGLNEVDAAIFLVKVSDKATAMTRELLFKIHEEKLYDGRFSSWDDFVESPDGLDKSRGWASKNLQVHKWALANSFARESLEGVDTERLYLASKMEGPALKALAKAQTLSRQDLKEELREADPCIEHVSVTICTKCQTRL
jgi:hypothetical protein